MKALFCFFLSAICLLSCNKDNESPYNTNVESFIDFKLQDSNGNNLLSGETTNSLSYADIDVIYFDNNIEKVYNNPLLDALKGYLIMNEGTNAYIRLYLNLPKNNETESLTYIKIKNSDIDTLKSLFSILSGPEGNYGGGSISVQKVWYNENLVLDKTVGVLTELPIIVK
ncbi:MAG: hypothetical protein PHR19_08595 [Bacteroidales bacterium]|nr:hypothetical protein [Bacteroidales bacterium]